MCLFYLFYKYKKNISMPKRYTCVPCNYFTERKSSYTTHITTKKHQYNMKNRLDIDESNRCIYCKRTFEPLKYLNRHMKSCKERKVYEVRKQLVQEEQAKQELQEKLQKQEEELEELKEVKEDYYDLLKQIAISKSKSSSNTINMYYIINNFNEAYNYEDLMRPALTDSETDELSNLEPLAGSIFVIKNRCIEDVDIQKRPIHCLDTSRDKYLLRTEDKWVVDHKAKQIFAKVCPLIYKHYLLDPQNPDNGIDKIIQNQQQLINMEKKSSQQKLIKELNDKVYIKNIKLDDLNKNTD